MTRKLSPELLRRIDSLSGCQGRWIVDCRELEGNYSYALRDLQEPCLYSSLLVPVGDDHRCWALYRLETLGLERGNNPTPEDAALYCAHTGWKSRLLFVSDLLREDCSWPGGYSPSAVYRSNARVFRDEFSRELELADGDGPDVALDVRYVTDEMLETLEGLEGYPLLSDDDHSQLEMELQQEAWDSWAASDWRQLVCAAVDQYLPERFPFDGDDLISRLGGREDEKLRALFDQCCDSAGEYWEEESDGGQYIRLDRVAEKLTLEDLRDLTGLPLEDPAELEKREQWEDQQRWRCESYPWPGAEPAPLLVAETL
jgi:hypothetical protein